MLTRTFFLALAIAFVSQTASAQESDASSLRSRAISEAAQAVDQYNQMLRAQSLFYLVGGVARAARAELLLTSYTEANPDDPDNEELVSLIQTMQVLSSRVAHEFITAPDPFDIERVGPLTLFLQIVGANMPARE